MFLTKKLRAATLLELITVVIIVGIVASFAVPSFIKTKEHALGNQAKANLKLIAAAEKVYRLELNEFYPSSGTVTSTNAINTNLKLALNEASWNYSIVGTGGTAFVAYAQRQNSCSGTYCNCRFTITNLIVDSEPAIDTGVCP